MVRPELGVALRKAARVLRIAGASAVTLVGVAGALFTLLVLFREPLLTVPSTTHPSIPRRGCFDCHEPIAAEWRQSFHYRSLSGPYWQDVRELGYTKLFDRTRKACVNCHAPANVLDLLDSRPVTASADGSLGVECTPNLLREPRGVIPAARGDEIELGVDCTSCHVGRQGILGTGRRSTSAHEVQADRRFQDPTLTSQTLCQTCHGSTVRAWKRTIFASQGVTCLDCHMPATTAASAAGGPERTRRSHRFTADKDPSVLQRAVHASLELTRDRKARFRIVNDRVGHHFPSGGNWLSVKFGAYDVAGRLLGEQLAVFGKEEPLLLDLWPFNLDRRIPSGEEREVLFSLPAGPGRVEAVVRYHDWMRTRVIVATLKERF